MIRILRTDPPLVLTRRAHKWQQAMLNAKSTSARIRAESKYRHARIKEALRQLFFGKCAYYESKIMHVDYGHIEHFRPKRGPRGRPDLVFDWNNLFLACGRCNGSEFKGDSFPDVPEGGPPVNPCDDDPAEHLEFHFDPVVGLASVYGRTRRGEITESLFGLNRRELRAYRSQSVRRLAALAQYAETDPEAAGLLRAAANADSEYSAFARVLLQRIEQTANPRSDQAGASIS